MATIGDMGLMPRRPLFGLPAEPAALVRVRYPLAMRAVRLLLS